MGTEILSKVFIRCCHPHLPPLSSVVLQAFGALELKGPLYMTSYCMQYVHGSKLTSNSTMDSALINRSSLYNSTYGQSVLNSVNRASYITIKSRGIRTKPRWTPTPKLLTATIAYYCPDFQVLDQAMHTYVSRTSYSLI